VTPFTGQEVWDETQDRSLDMGNRMVYDDASVLNERFTDWLLRIRGSAQSLARPLTSSIKYSEPKRLLRHIKKTGSYQNFSRQAHSDIDGAFGKPSTSSIKMGRRKGMIQNAEQVLSATKTYLRDPNEKIERADRALLQRWTNEAPGMIGKMKRLSTGKPAKDAEGDDDFDFGDDLDFEDD